MKGKKCRWCEYLAVSAQGRGRGGAAALLKIHLAGSETNGQKYHCNDRLTIEPEIIRSLLCRARERSARPGDARSDLTLYSPKRLAAISFH